MYLCRHLTPQNDSILVPLLSALFALLSTLAKLGLSANANNGPALRGTARNALDCIDSLATLAAACGASEPLLGTITINYCGFALFDWKWL